MRLLDVINDSTDLSLSKLWETVKQESPVCCSPWGRNGSDMTEHTHTQMNDKTLNIFEVSLNNWPYYC